MEADEIKSYDLGRLVYEVTQISPTIEPQKSHERTKLLALIKEELRNREQEYCSKVMDVSDFEEYLDYKKQRNLGDNVYLLTTGVEDWEDQSIEEVINIRERQLYLPEGITLSEADKGLGTLITEIKDIDYETSEKDRIPQQVGVITEREQLYLQN